MKRSVISGLDDPSSARVVLEYRERDVTAPIDTVVPPGAVISSAYAEYTANEALSTAITLDDSIPQSNEGTQILALSFAPKFASSKLRIRFDGAGSSTATPDALVAALFVNGGTDAVRATYTSVPTAGYEHNIGMTYEYSPGTTATQTIAIRVGSGTSGTIRMNGHTSGRLLGGAMACTLIVEEIKA